MHGHQRIPKYQTKAIYAAFSRDLMLFFSHLQVKNKVTSGKEQPFNHPWGYASYDVGILLRSQSTQSHVDKGYFYLNDHFVSYYCHILFKEFLYFGHSRKISAVT